MAPFLLYCIQYLFGRSELTNLPFWGRFPTLQIRCYGLPMLYHLRSPLLTRSALHSHANPHSPSDSITQTTPHKQIMAGSMLTLALISVVLMQAHRSESTMPCACPFHFMPVCCRSDSGDFSAGSKCNCECAGGKPLHSGFCTHDRQQGLQFAQPLPNMQRMRVAVAPARVPVWARVRAAAPFGAPVAVRA